MPYPVRPLDERLLAGVVDDGECWLFRGTPMMRYPYVKIGGGSRENIGAHRAAYHMWKGEIPDGMSVCHTCDTPRCINPDHLWLGTTLDNAIDKSRKGRHNIPSGRDHHLWKHGRYSKENRSEV